MTVDATIPTEDYLASGLVDLIVEEREQINSLWSAIAAVGGATTYEALNMGIGETEIALSGAGMVHTVALGAAGAVSLDMVTGATEGQLLLVKGTDANVTIVHSDSAIHLNGAADYTLAANDFIMLLNEGGAPSAAPVVDGIWIEVFRTVHT